jgi:hypothetical protein
VATIGKVFSDQQGLDKASDESSKVAVEADARAKADMEAKQAHRAELADGLKKIGKPLVEGLTIVYATTKADGTPDYMVETGAGPDTVIPGTEDEPAPTDGGTTPPDRWRHPAPGDAGHAAADRAADPPAAGRQQHAPADGHHGPARSAPAAGPAAHRRRPDADPGHDPDGPAAGHADGHPAPALDPGPRRGPARIAVVSGHPAHRAANRAAPLPGRPAHGRRGPRDQPVISWA